MRHDDALLLDMLLAAQDIREFTAGIDQAAFQANKLIRSAVMREVQVIGEAARMVSAEMRAQHPEIAWQEIAGMRNRIIHEYFSIDLDILWNVVQHDVVILLDQLGRIVPSDD